MECIQCTEDPNTTKKSLYLGTSGHLLHKRQMEHLGDLRRHQDSNALFKHQNQMHPGTPPNFRSRPLKGPIQYNLDRFILEAHKIERASQDPNIHVMNSRSEWGYRGLPRITLNQ